MNDSFEPVNNNAELAHRFKFHPATDNVTKDRHEVVRTLCRKLAMDLNSWLPDGREKALAMTNLEQTMFWSNAAIARAGK